LNSEKKNKNKNIMPSRLAETVGPFTRLMRFIFKDIIMHICITLGISANTLTLIVLLQKRMRVSSTSQYLTALTIFDSIYIICAFANSMQAMYQNLSIFSDYYIPYANIIFYPLGDFCSNSSIYIILVFTIERSIAVSFPLRARQWCRPSRARKIIFLTVIFCFIFTFPTFLENRIIYLPDDNNKNITRPFLTKSSFIPDGYFELYQSVYFPLSAIIFQILPFTLLIILNSILMKFIHTSMKMSNGSSNGSGSTSTPNSANQTNFSGRFSSKFKKKKNKNDSNEDKDDEKLELKYKNNNKLSNKKLSDGMYRNNMSQLQKEQNKATMLLIATVLLFLICQLPNAIMLLFHSIMTPEQRKSDLVIGINNISNGLVAINASVNFILYSCFSERFRNTFHHLLTKIYCYKDRNIRETSSYNPVYSNNTRIKTNNIKYNS
jgi:hypothetical protein